ncbi:MAG: SAM-dependent methyltransferase [Spirochaetota bacterium]
MTARIEFGDFQTPIALAEEVLTAIPKLESFDKIIEPTCGTGSFLHACLQRGMDPRKIAGWELHPDYVQQANTNLKKKFALEQDLVKIQDFFTIDWQSIDTSQKKVLFIGNPPWVTNTTLGKLQSENLPQKRNSQKLVGIEAMTGKSNFDISEWMLRQLLHQLPHTESSLAFLIKTSVARKLFEYTAKNQLCIQDMQIRKFVARKHFPVHVDACLFLASGCGQQRAVDRYECKLYTHLSDHKTSSTLGMYQGRLLANKSSFSQYRELDTGCEFQWRSGVKHDAAKVMEFTRTERGLCNGYQEIVSLPPDYLFPLYKSSDISKTTLPPPRKMLLVTQKRLAEETESIREYSPATWQYLCKHRQKLDGRKSSIYKLSPRFAIFGIGGYTFSPWKIAISGLYKNLQFSKIGRYRGKPIVLDDTCYMLDFALEAQADLAQRLLNSQVCRELLRSLTFLDQKRPVTMSLLNRINLRAIAEKTNLLREYEKTFRART